MSQVTTDVVELEVKKDSVNGSDVLTVKANGSYKFPFIYNKDGELIVPNRIEISNVTHSMSLSRDILNGILRHNSKQILKSGVSKPVHKMCYVDEKGAITYNSGACVTYFNLESPVRFLLNEKTVRLFKLFKFDFATLTLGFNTLESGEAQMVVRFEDNQIELTSILNTDKSMIDSIPVTSIRALAESDCAYRVVVDKKSLLNALDRLELFSKDVYVMSFTYIEYSDGQLILRDTSKHNSETVAIVESDVEHGNYSFAVVTNDLIITLETIEEEYVVLKFGNGKAVMTEQPNVKNILPEVQIQG